MKLKGEKLMITNFWLTLTWKAGVSGGLRRQTPELSLATRRWQNSGENGIKHQLIYDIYISLLSLVYLSPLGRLISGNTCSLTYC